MNRRQWILTALANAGAYVLATTAATQAADKMSKLEAEYQDSPKDIRMCATCTLFEPPKSCKVVEGDASPYGWCKVFALAD